MLILDIQKFQKMGVMSLSCRKNEGDLSTVLRAKFLTSFFCCDTIIITFILLFAPISTRIHSMAPPVNPYKKKPLFLLPPSSGMIIRNPYKKQRSHTASGATANEEQQTKTHQDESIDPRTEAAWITPRKYLSLRSNKDDGDQTQLTSDKENIITTSSVTVANAGRRGINHDDHVPTMGCVTPASNGKANAKDKDENGTDHAIDNNDSNNNLDWTVVSVFKVFASGTICMECNNKPIGSGIDSVR
jgi:hypothetical protein